MIFSKGIKIKRRQLFEFNDLKWWPDLFRSMTTDFLHSVIEKHKPYSVAIDLIAKAIKSTKSNKIVDLCSGSLGPWLHLKEQLENKTRQSINITFTDKYPNTKLSKEFNILDGASYNMDSIDAVSIPKSLDGTRTIFNGLHHFNPEDAQKIIADAVNNNQPIVIFELLRRSWLDITMVTLFTPLYVLLNLPFLLPLTFKNILFTYIIPIFPIVFTWDTIVSHLRCYSQDELNDMIEKADVKNSYKKNIGSYTFKFLPVTYMICYPKF